MITAMIDQETRELALRTFKNILEDQNSKPADRLRAAEGVLKLEQEERDKGMGDVLDASDEELLNRARGGGPKPQNDPAEDGNPAQ
jgi:hypothetical protein